MGFLWMTAWKNLFRHRMRSFISILAISIAVAAIVFSRSLIKGMADNIYKHHITLQGGHLKIITQEYYRKERFLPLHSPVDGFRGEGIEEMAKDLLKIPGIEKVIPRIHFGALFSDQGTMISMMGWGIDLEKEGSFSPFPGFLVEGRMMEGDRREVVLGKDLLIQVDKKVGETITMVYYDTWGSFRATSFTITGVMKSNLPLIDKKSFLLSLGVAQGLLDMPHQATVLLLLTPDRKRSSHLLSSVQEAFLGSTRNYLILPWEKSHSTIAFLMVGEKIYQLIYLLIILLAAVVVVNTMLMIVKERTKEIGLMKAMGLTTPWIMALFLLEGTLMGIIGSIGGVVLGGGGTLIMSQIGIDYTELIGIIGDQVFISPIHYPVFSWKNLLFCFTFSVIIMALSCVIPARKASLLEPSEALRKN